MKKSGKTKTILLCILVITTMIFSSIFAYAETVGQKSQVDYSSLEFMAASGVTTVITDIYGGTQIFDGMLKSESLTDNPSADMISSYKVIMNGNVLITIELHDIVEEEASETDHNRKLANDATSEPTSGGGYYSATFDVLVGSTPCEAYLTGLTDTAGTGSVMISDVETAIISAISSGSKYVLIENADFIDAEKISSSSSYGLDSQLCWAGTVSNILHYTGWANKAVEDQTNKDASGNVIPMQNEDAILDIFMNAFTNNGGGTSCGITWFFNGYNYANSWRTAGNVWAYIDSTNYEYKKFLGFLPKYSAQNFCTDVEANSAEELNYVLERLKAGDGVGIGIDWYSGNSRSGGHATTLWGYVIDPSKDVSDSSRYKKLFFGDSDNDKTYNTSRPRDSRTNQVAMVTLQYTTINSENRWKMDGYSSSNGYISDFSLLKRYSTSAVSEPADGGGTCNLMTSPNLCHDYYYISGSSTDNGSEKTVFTVAEAKNGIYYYDRMYNLSEVAVDIGDEKHKVGIVIKRNGEKIWEGTDGYTYGSLSEYGSNYKYYLVDYKLNNSNVSFSAGKYEVIVTYDCESKVAEAYESDNTVVMEFEVLPGASCTVKKTNGNKKLSVTVSPDLDGIYVVATYDSNNKLTGLSYKTNATAGTNFSSTFNGASSISYVKVFKLSSDYLPERTVQTVAV